MKKYILVVFGLFIIVCLIVFFSEALDFSSRYKEYKSSNLGYNNISTSEYNSIVKYLYGDTLGRKLTFYDKYRNPISFFKNSDSQNVFLHKLNTSKNLNIESIVLTKSKDQVKGNNLYRFLLPTNGLPVQVKMNSAHPESQNTKVYIQFDGELINSIQKSNSLLKIKLKFNSLSIGYSKENFPDIYMAIDNGSGLRKFKQQIAELIFLKTKQEFFMIFTNETY